MPKRKQLLETGKIRSNGIPTTAQNVETSVTSQNEEASQNVEASATPQSIPTVEEKAEEIYDPLVFKLAYLEERKAHLLNLQALRHKIYDERLMQLKYERKIEMEKIEAEQIRINEALAMLRKELEAKHNINLKEFGYDDEVGKFIRLPSTEKKEE